MTEAYRNGPAIRLWKHSRAAHRRGLFRIARLLKAANLYLHHAILPPEAIVGERLLMIHNALGVVLHPNVSIGGDCWIYHQVTLATESPVGSPHRIVVGDFATLGAMSIVVGRGNRSLHIGRGAVLGAGSVLTKDIPEGEVWAGNPARFVRENHRYDGERVDRWSPIP